MKSEEPEDFRQGSFIDEDGQMHIRVPNIGGRPPQVVKRHRKKDPVAFETITPRAKIEEKAEEKREAAPVHRLGDGHTGLIDDINQSM